MIKLVKKVFNYLLFFPSVTFNLVSAEIFPWAFIFSLLNGNKISKSIIYFLSFIFFQVLITFIFIDNVNIFEALRSSFAYINPLIVFFLLFHIKDTIIYNFKYIVLTIFIFLTIFGFFQFFSILNFTEPFFLNIVPRMYMSPVGGNRGVTF